MLIADKAFDADERVIEPLKAAGKTALIPPKANRRSPRTYDRHQYRARHPIENLSSSSSALLLPAVTRLPATSWRPSISPSAQFGSIDEAR